MPANSPDPASTWNLPEADWDALAAYVHSHPDALEDGATVRFDADTGDLLFYASAFCKPAGWRYPFLEPVPGTSQHGAFVGRAFHDPSTGFVHFEVIVYAAAQALRADYESDVSDLDYVTYEQAVEEAVRGGPADEDWLHAEFARLHHRALR